MRKSRFWLIIAIALFLGAIGLSGYNLILDSKGGQSSAEISDELALALENVPKTTIRNLRELTLHDMQNWSDSDELPVEELSLAGLSRNYIGLITFPKLSLQLPVQENWSYENLRISPCRMMGTPETRDLVILAHNYTSHFGKLNRLKLGDEVSLTLTDGTTYVYYVDATEIVEPTAIESVSSGEWPLTLFTCTLGGKTRLVVHCDMED